MRFKIKLLIFIILFFIFIPLKSYAVLYASGESYSTKPLATWIESVRKMETLNQGLGLNDTINTTNTNDGSYLTSSSESSNGLDVHMQKNTEYGAMAILSASDYGNPEIIKNGETTTGNKSGVTIYIGNKRWEYTAAGQLSAISNFQNASPKYKNVYSVSVVGGKDGDAIIDTKGWHGGSSEWFSYSWGWPTASGYASVLRAYSGSIFSYYGANGNTNYILPACATNSWATRAVIVIGEGF